MALLNNARGLIITAVEPLFVNGGVGLDNTNPQITDTSIFGGGVTIDSCEATTGWSVSGDGSAVTLNTTSGEYIEGTACINLPTSHSTGVAKFYKTISDTNLSGKIVAVWYYIDNVADLADSVDAISIDLGTGGFTNYNTYNFNRDELASGWNSLVIDADSLDASSGSGATLATVNRVRLNVKADLTQATNDMRMDYLRYYESGTLGIADSINPLSVTTGNYYIKTTHNIAATESNGLEIVESGDSTASVLLSRQTFAAINKGSNTSIQIDKYYYLD